jgi:hypothetical protein
VGNSLGKHPFGKPKRMDNIKIGIREISCEYIK